MKLIVWTPDIARRELHDRIKASQEARERFERLWDRCEQVMYNIGGPRAFKRGTVPDLSQTAYALGGDDTSGFAEANSGVNYAFKNVRFIHSQLSANPPTIACRPQTPDAEDRRKALAGENLKQFALRKFKLQEKQDQVSLSTVIYGTGVLKVFNNPDAGEILDVDAEGNITAEGDFELLPLNIRNVFVDPDATCEDEIRYVIEKKFIPYEDALQMWPGQKHMLENYRVRDKYEQSRNSYDTASWHHDAVVIYEYWEKGSPSTAMLGRYAICLEDGSLLSDVTTNPHAFTPPAKDGCMEDGTEPSKRRFPVAKLPYKFFTDIDVPGTIWGMCSLMYALDMQNVVLDLDAASVDNAYAHSAARIILPEGAEIAEGSITNSPLDIIKITGTQPPHFMAPAPLQQAAIELRNTYVRGIDDVFGVNESMFGQQSRETSGFSMQYATNQGNMIRRRLFNKYTMFVEDIYNTLFDLVRKHWTTPRTIHVIGAENTMNAVSFSGADIAGGFDIVGEYGTNFSLDPVSRRQEILTLYPVLKEAGIEATKVVEMLRLNDFSKPSIESLGEERQKEIFHEMITRNTYIPPTEMQDHKNMLAWAYYWLMTAEYRDLSDEHKALIRQHIVDREELIKKLTPPAGPPGAPITTSLPGMPPPPPGAPAMPMPPPAM